MNDCLNAVCCAIVLLDQFGWEDVNVILAECNSNMLYPIKRIVSYM